MPISARVIADSVNPNGDRLTTWEGVLWRATLAELNTHRMLSRNSASSRAIPLKRTMAQVWRDPAGPVYWGRNQAGMQARRELRGLRRWLAIKLFYLARYPALLIVLLLRIVDLHKQVANRLLEPWMWHTVIISATSTDNFFTQRLGPDAQPEIRVFAEAMDASMRASVPMALEWGMWHLPYNTIEAEIQELNQRGGYEDDLVLEAKVSAARCARVSYVRQNETRESVDEVKMADKLASNRHYSPLEHPAQAMPVVMGNFSGFKQLRKFYADESGVRERQ